MLYSVRTLDILQDVTVWKLFSMFVAVWVYTDSLFCIAFLVLTDDMAESDLSRFSSIQIGDMIGVYVEHHWESNPQIGKVLDVNLKEETFTIHWYYSTWTGKCRPLFLGGGAHRKPKTEILDVRCALLWQFNLTPSDYLKSVTAQHLKTAYKDLNLQCWMRVDFNSIKFHCI